MLTKNTETKIGFTLAMLLLLVNSASARSFPVPDAGSSAALLGVAIAGLTAIRRFMR